jgi:DNA-binding transcriptional MerR regulator
MGHRGGKDLTKPYRVHEFAELAGVTAKTLRHYDRLWLLRPLRTAAGYRVYSEKDLHRLERIVALKFLGLPLKEISRVLDRSMPLTKVLLGQRTVLEEKRHLLERAIEAIQDVERVIASCKQPDAAILRKLIEVIAMQSHVQTMKQYYSNAAWEKLTRLRQQYSDAQRSGLSESWTKLVREAQSILSKDPAGEKAQEFCERWIHLLQSTTGGDAEVLAGLQKSWADRANWPAELQPLVGFDPKAVGDFIRKAYAVSMKKYYNDEAWARKVTLDDRSEIKPGRRSIKKSRVRSARIPQAKKDSISLNGDVSYGTLRRRAILGCRKG